MCIRRCLRRDRKVITVKILFQGDSITDAGRDRRNYHDVGPGYAKYASEQIVSDFPAVDFEFINLGISGNRTSQLFDRLYSDGIEFNPDIISLLIGINDVWHRHSHNIATTNEQVEVNYRSILERIKNETNAKIIMIEPFLLDAPGVAHFADEVKELQGIVRSLAEKYADVFIPLGEKFDDALATQPAPLYYSADGVHPNENGRAFIGALYAEAAKPLIKMLIN